MVTIFKKIQTLISNWCVNAQTIQIQDLHNQSDIMSVEIYDNNKLKFIEQGKIDNSILVETPTGYSPIKHSHKTVPYVVYDVILNTGKILQCADKHILITDTGNEIYVRDLIPNKTKIQTKFGISTVTSVLCKDKQEYMYDLELDDVNHVYYTNDILSHNSTTASAFLLWFAIFHENKHILIVSNRNAGSMEMITRIEFMYEHLPHWLKPAIDADHWNMHSKWFDNGSKIDSEATTPQSGRGLSISLLFCLGGDTNITLRNKNTGEVKTIPIEQAYDMLT